MPDSVWHNSPRHESDLPAMNLDELAIGWREAVLGVVALLVLYVLFVVFRLRRIRRQPVPPEAIVSPATDTTGGEGATPLAAKVAAAYAEPDFPWNEPPDAPSASERLAALEVELGSLRSEMETLRGEVSAMSGELTAARSEIRRDIDRVGEQVQATQHVAPIYGDAMQMALAGHDAATIAERCGVARAEAELVVALIRNRDDQAASDTGGRPGDDPQSLNMRER